MSRLLELATKGAFWLHLDSESSEHDAAFETCRHPDCVLVRASAPSVVEPATEPVLHRFDFTTGRAVCGNGNGPFVLIDFTKVTCPACEVREAKSK